MHNLALRKRFDIPLSVGKSIAVTAVKINRQRAKGTDIGTGTGHAQHCAEIRITIIGKHISGYS